jgi:hypothetical protein
VIESRMSNGKLKKLRRFILWCRAQNTYAYKHGYVPHMEDLKHISAFLQDLAFESATLRDLVLSFFEIEIPLHARALYRFYDSAGSLYEMLRLPMGHVCSPELMQMVCGVLSGDPRWCKPEFSLQVESRVVWIDNIRLCGSRADMLAAGAWLDKTAASVKAQYKAEESRTAVSEYDFLGGAWNHGKSQIKLSQKGLDKLPLSTPSAMSFRDASMRRACFVCTFSGTTT